MSGRLAAATLLHAGIALLLAASTAVDAKLKAPAAVNSTVFERGLVREDISWRDVTRGHNRYHRDTHTPRFAGPVLAFVTPWNGKGYEVAKRFRGKFTHIAPVWYQLKRSPEGFFLTGGHDVDQGWLAALRSKEDPGRLPKVVPRVLFELQPDTTAGALLSSAQAVTSILAAEALQHGFDGWVLEVWSQWAQLGALRSPQSQQRVHAFVRELGSKLRGAGLEVILAVPPALKAHPQGPAFTAADWAAVGPHVSGAAVMTYDHAVAGPGPNAPLPWVAANVRALAGSGAAAEGAGNRGSLFVGLNLYGMDWALGSRPGAEPLLGPTAVQLLQRHRPRLQWHAEPAEHSFAYVTNGQGHRAWLPSPASVQARLALAAGAGAGVALWEVGQGLEYLYDLL